MRTFPILGALMGAVLSVRALLGYGIAAASGKSLGIPLFVLLLVYPLCGMIGGLVVASAFPLTRWLGGAFLVGALAMTPMYVGVGFLINQAPTKESLIIGSICGLIVGGFVGAGTWLNEDHPPLRLGHLWLFAIVSSAVAWTVGLHWAGKWEAALAIPLFLIPVGLALLGTFGSLDRSRNQSDGTV